MIMYNSSKSFDIFIKDTKKGNIHTKSYLVSCLSWTYITIKKHILKKRNTNYGFFMTLNCVVDLNNALVIVYFPLKEKLDFR